MIVIVMGVSGSGKTTVGALLAESLQCTYLEGDSLHPASNIGKMSRGIPLTDADRVPWLSAIRTRLREAFGNGRSLVVGCSALKRSYRDFLAEGLPVTWVYLKGSEDLIRSRLEQRTSHFVNADLLSSQLAALEEPEDVILADIAQPPRAIVEQIMSELRAT